MKRSVRHLVSAVLIAGTIQAESQFVFVRGDTVEPCGDSVLPCVVQDICTTCGTKSCISCAKCTSQCAPCKRQNGLCNTGCFTCSVCSTRLGIESNGICVQCNKGGKLPDGRLGTKTCKQECTTTCNTVRSIFIPRSVGANTARELAGWQEFIHRWSPGRNYVTVAHSLGYSRSFDPERIARYLFSDCTLIFSGSQVRERRDCELLADNFGLSPSFRGQLRVSPVIDNVFFDTQIFVGLDEWLCGLYVRAHAPLVHTRWDLRMHEKVEEQECPPFPACYMGPDEAKATCSIVRALSGTFRFGDMQERWKFGKFAGCGLSKTGLADIDLIVGWDFLKCENYHIGIFGLVVAPTGNKPKGEFIFEPVIGNAKHVELGAGLSGHLVLWQEGLDQSLSIYLEGNITHMFKNRQVRSFDLCRQGPLSRYLLLKEFRREGEELIPTGRIINGINFVTREIETCVPVKGDVSVKLSLRIPCIAIDLGYNFYGHAQERIKFCRAGGESTFGIKGTEGTCALEYQTVGTQQPLSFGSLVKKIPLNATQSNATITSAGTTDNAKKVAVNSPEDIAVTAFSRQSGLIVGPDIQEAFASNPPVLLSDKDLNKDSGAAGPTATHKVFGYIGYTFEDACRWYIPYVGVGGEFEVDALACNERTSLNQWSLWIKGGISF